MAGHDKPALMDEELRAAIRNPIESPRLCELAQGKERIVILFDDLTKPTPAGQILHFVLEELHAGGIRDDQIRLLCAPGTHRPLTYSEFAAKLGADIVARYPVYNHNIWENLVDVGTTSRGTPVYVNREYVCCDLRIGVGCLVPHPLAGFGGGGKLVVPGVAGIETVESHHRNMAPSANLAEGHGKVLGNIFREDLEEAALLAGLQFKVDSVVNNRREVIGLFAGDFVAEHRCAARLAGETYKTDCVEDADIVIANGYPNEGQFVRSTWCIERSLRKGGDAVLVSYSHDGQNLHQYSGRYGTDYGGRNWRPGGRAASLARAERVLVLAPQLSMYDRNELGAPGKVTWCKNWEEVAVDLAGRWGAGTRVAVYPYAPLQLP